MANDVVAPAVARDACAHGNMEARTMAAASVAAAVMEEEELLVWQLENLGLILLALALLAESVCPPKLPAPPPSTAPMPYEPCTEVSPAGAAAGCCIALPEPAWSFTSSGS